MCLTDGEMVFLDYCREQETPGFPLPDREAASYWEPEDLTVPPVSVYGFDTPMEMEACLQPYLESEQLRKILTAEAFQKLAAQQEQDQKGRKEEEAGIIPCGERETAWGPACETELPAYVYNF